MSESASPAVFLSYAREDAGAARRIAEAVRSSGIEVWFDENELHGGEAWDAKIRKQINDCTLFVPVVSQHTEARGKGYFRLEWKLAVEQTHMLAEGVPFIAPVVIDDTREAGAVVPAEFLRVQWTRLPGALPTPQFVGQIKRLLHAPHKPAAASRAAPGEQNVSAPRPSGLPLRIVGAVAVIAAGAAVYFALRPAAKETLSPAAAKPSAPLPIAPGLAPAAAPAADKSIAVLPFANLSTEKENEFFADGVHDDIITNLQKIHDLKVISRTSVLGYRDSATRTNLKKIADELGVATVLEGSLRRVGTKVHMNAKLLDARTEASLWAETFDGDTSDIFALQASLAQKIAAALKATLTAGERTLIERRPTENPQAYELYLQARLLEQALTTRSALARFEQVAAIYQQAVAIDPTFALAYARLAVVQGEMYFLGHVDPTPLRRLKAEAAMNASRRLATGAPETRMAQGAFTYFCDND